MDNVVFFCLLLDASSQTSHSSVAMKCKNRLFNSSATLCTGSASTFWAPNELPVRTEFQKLIDKPITALVTQKAIHILWWCGSSFCNAVVIAFSCMVWWCPIQGQLPVLRCPRLGPCERMSGWLDADAKICEKASFLPSLLLTTLCHVKTNNKWPGRTHCRPNESEAINRRMSKTTRNNHCHQKQKRQDTEEPGQKGLTNDKDQRIERLAHAVMKMSKTWSMSIGGVWSNAWTLQILQTMNVHLMMSSPSKLHRLLTKSPLLTLCARSAWWAQCIWQWWRTQKVPRTHTQEDSHKLRSHVVVMQDQHFSSTTHETMPSSDNPRPQHVDNGCGNSQELWSC